MGKRVRSTLEKVAKWSGAEDEAAADIKKEREAAKALRAIVKKGWDARGEGLAFARRSVKGMLSPAGLTEDVVGRVLKNMGADKGPMYQQREIKRRTVTGRPKSKA